MTPPTNFRVIGVGQVNLAYKFYWDPVAGASYYNLKEHPWSCPQNADIVTNIPANDPQPYRIIGRIPACNGQTPNSATFWYSMQACNGTRCSEWTATIPFTVSVPATRSVPATTTTYIHTDGLHSPVAYTDATGTVTERVRYERTERR